jgi:hypothetical protein
MSDHWGFSVMGPIFLEGVAGLFIVAVSLGSGIVLNSQ